MKDALPKKAFAFVLPRYFESLAGGAETLSSKIAFKLAEDGHKVEMFVTCAKDNRTWENHFSPGRTIENGVPVNRFSVDPRNLDIWIPRQISISQGMRIKLEDQLDWMREGVNSQDLYAEIVRRDAEFDYFIFAPYLFPTTFWGSMMLSHKAILIPCLHDENMAYLDVIAGMFREVRGAIFNALPEMKFAEGLYGRVKGGEVGMGFEEFDKSYVDSLRPHSEISEPYILYLGRKETGKNVHLLIDYFIEAKEKYNLPSELKLVIAGGGSFKDLHRSSVLTRDDIIDIEHLPEEGKHSLMKSALVMCQPSTNESFSIVMMESWLLGTPCLVHSECAVTVYHVEESGGGLHFRNEAEFAEAVKLLHNSSQLRERLSSAGIEYVKDRYNWTSVLDRFSKVIEEISSEKLQNDEAR